MDLEFLKDFHRKRVQLLADAGPDLIAFETVPNKLEAQKEILIYFRYVEPIMLIQAFTQLLDEENIKVPAWISFNSKDGVNVVSGDPISECASVADSCKRVLLVGINCTPPRFIHNLILDVKKVTSKPIVIYPNSGENYDADRKEWVQNTGVPDEDFVSYVHNWCEAGAALVGGCCRTTPNTIRGIYETLRGKTANLN
ncbi:hypothetical protein LIER_30382 [Lithospermum erythrorhizon]|uniref:Hcy-binding domain-containing protein n=1 Tax=Lithospermum erythrorhizon TaxID=34254 RepID=A0AAV3RQI4_LITER